MRKYHKMFSNLIIDVRSDNFEFDELPEINTEFRAQIDSFRNMFTGDHKLTLIEA